MPEPKESIRIGAPPTQAVLVVPQQQRRRLRWEVPITVAAVGVLLFGGIALVGVLKDANTHPQAGASASPSPSATIAADPHGAKACQLNAEASAQDQLLDDAAVLRIQSEGLKSENVTIRFDSQKLVDEHVISKAEIARGGSNLELALAVSSASLQMQTDCLKAGFVN